MEINNKIIFFSILELFFLSFINFIGIWAISLSLIVCILELTILEKIKFSKIL